MRKEPKEYAHTVFRIIVEAHNKSVHKPNESEQGERDQSYIVSSILFVSLGGIEGTIHLESLLNNSKIELEKLKPYDSQRQDELAKHDETKSLAYLYKILEELSNQKGEDLVVNNDHLDEIYEASTFTKFLKFYLKNGNSKVVFISCVLTLEPFSCFSHDCLHNASLIENIFTKHEHESLKVQKWFTSKYLEIKTEIEDLKHKIESLSDPRVRRSIVGEHYDLVSKKSELAAKIDKLLQKILNAGQVKVINAKIRHSLYQHEESGLFSINESDISRGAFEIGMKSFLVV